MSTPPPADIDPPVAESRPVTSQTPQGFLADIAKPPNLITLARLVLATILFGIISFADDTSRELWMLAVVLFLLAAVTDALDGYVARRYDMVTKLGRILDPFADKFIIGGCFVFLLERGAESTGVTAWIVIAVLGRDMLITSLRGYLEREGHDFSASWAGKWKMVAQCVAISICLIALTGLLGEWILTLRNLSLWAAVLITIYSGVVYVQRASKMLRIVEE